MSDRNGVRCFALSALFAVSVLSCRVGQAASGVWTGGTSAVWAHADNWDATPFPSGADTATFNGLGGGYTVIDLAGLSSIKTVVIDSAGVAPYTLGVGGANGQTLILENSGLILMTNGVLNAQRVDASVQLGTTTSASTTTAMNASPGSTLTLAGHIAGAPSGGTPGLKTFVIAGAGDTVISGNLSDGGASQVNLIMASTGVCTLSGVNTFSGPVAINGAGTLSVSKMGNRFSTDSSLGAGTNVSFGANNAKLLYTGAGESSDRLFTVTGGTPLTIEHAGTGPLLLTGDFVTTTTSGVNRELVLQGDDSVGEFAGVFSDYNEDRYNKLTKKGTGTWTLSGDNLFKGTVTIVDGILRLQAGGSLGAGVKTVTIVGNTTNLRPSLQLAGADGPVVVPAEITLRTSNKQTGAIINESGTNTIASQIELTQGDNYTHIWSYAGRLTLSGTITAINSDRRLYLRGDGDGEVSGVIQNGSTVNLPVYKDVGSGTWTLTGSNTYSGATTVDAGTLALAGADGSINASSSISVTGGATLRIDNRADANNGDRLKDTATVALNTGSLIFANNGGDVDTSESAGALSISGTGNTLGTSQGDEGRSATLTFASLTRVGSALLSVTGEGLGESDRNRVFITGVANGTVFNWISVNGSSVSGYDSARGLYAIGVPGTDIAAYGDMIVSNDASNVRINSEGTTGPIALSETVTVIRSLAQNTGFEATVDTVGKTLRAETFLVNEGKAGLTLGVSPNDGIVASPVSGGRIAFLNYSSNALTVNASVADNGPAASEVVKEGSGTLVLAGSNAVSGPVAIKDGTLALAGSPALPGASGAVLSLGGGTNVTRLSYLGAGQTIARTIDLAGTTVGPVLEQAGSGLLKFTGDMTSTGQGNKTLTLDGNTDGVGELAGLFADGPGYTNKLSKTGSGTWVLSNANTFSGDTEIRNGKLVLTHPNALTGSARVNFLSRAPDGFLELAHDGTGETPVNVIVGIGYNGTLMSGVATGDTGINHSVGDLALSGMTLTVARGSNVVNGAPSVTAQSVNLSGGGAHTSTLNPTTADLILGNVSMLSNPFNKTLKLDGTSVGNRVDGVIDNGVHTITVQKSNASTWTLTGANTYTGTTTVAGGTLALSGANGAIGASRSVTLSGNATLVLQNSAAANHTDRLGNAIPITLSGGTFRFAHSGGAAGYSETAGPLSVDSGDNTIDASLADVGQTSAVTFDALVRTAGAVDFAGTELGVSERNQVLFTTEPTLVNGVLGAWATVNGGPLATYGAYGVTAYTNYGELAAKGPSTLPDAASANLRITSEGSGGGIDLAGALTNSIYSLYQNTEYPATVPLASKTLLASGIHIAPGKASLTIGSGPGDGFLSALATDGELVLGNYSDSALTVNAALVNNGTASSLAKNGPGPVVVNGPTPYAGSTVINGGALTFGGDTFPQALAGVISGGGGLVKSGTNLLHLLASNTYTGPTAIQAGIVRVNQNSAFGATDHGVTIADGATLDLGCTPDVGGTRPRDGLNMQNQTITVQGAGLYGQGAIMNNSTSQQAYALGNVTLAGDTTFSTGSRWDLRSGTFNMNDHGVTKLGASMWALTYENVVPGGDQAQIDVQEGALRIQVSTKLNGTPANTVRVRSGAALELYRVDHAQDWGVFFENNSTFNLAVESNASTQNRWAGPVTLEGAVTLTGGSSSSHVGDLQGSVSGSGPLTKTGTATLTISGTNNTYTGETRIQGGRLVVTSLRNIGEPCSLGQPPAGNAAIKIGVTTSTYSLDYTGAGDTSDRPIDLAGTTAGAYIYHNGTGPLKLTGNLAASGTGSKTLTLRGDAGVPAEFAGVISDAGGNATSVYKQDTGEWLLSGTNTYSGTTRVYNGVMTVAGGSVLPGNLYVYGGALTFTGSNTCSGSATVYSRMNLAGTGGGITGYYYLNGEMVVSGTNDQGSGHVRIGSSNSSNGVMRVLSGAAYTGAGAEFHVGFGTGSAGALYVEGGVLARTSTASDKQFNVGYGQDSYGYLNISGGMVSGAARLTVGGYATSLDNAIGIIRMTGGTLAIPSYVLLGRNAGSAGILTVQEDSLFNHANGSQNIILGNNGGRADLNLLGGTVDGSGRNVSVRMGSSGVATGSVNLCAGMLTANKFELGNAGSSYFVNFRGGTFKVSAAGTPLDATLTAVTLFGASGGFAGGAVIDTDGRDVTVAASLAAPAGNGVSAVALADGGSGCIGEPLVTIAPPPEGGIPATAVADMEPDGNGAYRVASITVTCPGSGYTAPPSVTFAGGGTGAVLPTVEAVTLAPNASGGLTKRGNGTLTLNAANTYTGTTTVAGGTLKLGMDQALPATSAVLLTGGTLDLGGFTVTNGLTSVGGFITNGTLQSELSPAGAGVIGTNTFTLSGGATLRATAYLADTDTHGNSDTVNVLGDIDLSDAIFTLVDPNQLDRHQQYTLLTCTGTRSGEMAATNLPERWRLVYRADGSVVLMFVDGTLIKVK